MIHAYPASKENIRFNSDQEKKIYDELSLIEDDNWYFWYSWDYFDGKRSETDFLIFHKKFGFCVIEEKGGGIELDENGEWYTIDYKNERNPLSKSPLEQAEDCQWDVLRFYKKNILESEKNIYLLAGDDFPGLFLWIVYFPNCTFKLDNPNNPFLQKKVSERIYDREERSNNILLKDFILNLFTKYAIKHPKQYMSPAIISKFTNLFTSRLSSKMTLADALSVFKNKIAIENAKQDYIIDSFRKNSKILISGYAGTGKTFFAMKKVIEQVKEGNKTLLLCYNSNLVTFIQNKINNIQFGDLKLIERDSSFFKILNIHSLIFKSASHLTRKAKKYLYDLLNMKKRNNKQSNDLRDFISKLVMSDNFMFDSLIIDEAQDIESGYVNFIYSHLHSFNDAVIYVFYDQFQNIFNAGFDLEAFKIGSIPTLELNINIRNSKQICNHISQIPAIEYSTHFGVSGPAIIEKESNSIYDCFKDIARDIYNQIEEGKILESQITVLSPFKFNYLSKNLNQISRRRFKSSNKEFIEYYYLNIKIEGQNISFVESKSYQDLGQIRNYLNFKIIAHSGVGSFKGLENDIIYLIKIRNDKQSSKTEVNQRQMREYVGFSRARYQLVIYSC